MTEQERQQRLQKIQHDLGVDETEAAFILGLGEGTHQGDVIDKEPGPMIQYQLPGKFSAPSVE